MPVNLCIEEGVSYAMDRLSPHLRRASVVNASNMNNCPSPEMLKIWSQLPEQMRLDPKLAIFQEEYEKNGNRLEFDTTLTNYCSVTSISAQLETASKYTCNKNDKQSDNKFSSFWLKFRMVFRYIKLALLVSIWIGILFVLMTTKEEKENAQLISVSNKDVKSIKLGKNVLGDKVSVTIEGPFSTDNIANTSYYRSLPYTSLQIWLESLDVGENFTYKHVIDNDEFSKIISETWNLPILVPDLTQYNAIQRKIKTFDLKYFINDSDAINSKPIAINLGTNSNETISFSLSYDVSPMDIEKGLALGASVLIGLYILIVFELVHRTLASLLAATSAIAILAALNEKPTVSQITSWIDFDTLMLLFSMMVLVAIVGDTGTFDYFAAYAYRITKGKVLPLVSTICFFTAFVSAFLDNVTVIMLMTPVTIKLCEVIKINPVPVLTLMVIFSNVGGAATPVGDPPNVIVASNRHVIAAGVGFSTFTIHMGIGVILALVVIYGHFRFVFRNVDIMRFSKSEEKIGYKIEFWRKAINTLSNFDESNNLAGKTLLEYAKEVLGQLESKQTSDNNLRENYKTVLKELNEKYSIRDRWLLVKSGFCMVLVIVLFFMHSSPNFHLTIGSSTFLCVLLLLILADDQNFDDLMTRVEWSTLLFFASLFVLMEALTELGLISWIGNKTELIITSVNEESRLMVAILLLLWVSAIAGAFIDNVPLTTMMIRIVIGLSKNSKLQLPLQPLVWALAFGASFGGNGTLIGATTNVVCAGVAEQHGYRITFLQFFKMGFPVLLTTTFTMSLYLIVAHVIFEWNY